MQSNVKLAHAMGSTTRGMAAVNAQMSPQAMQQTLQQFEMESAKMEMKEEMSKLILTGYFSLNIFCDSKGRKFNYIIEVLSIHE